jgi:recombination protein RecA
MRKVFNGKKSLWGILGRRTHVPIDQLVGTWRAQYGEDRVRLGHGPNPSQTIEHLSTGHLSLDLSLDLAALPAGQVIEIFGQAASGKTTLALHLIAQAQRSGGLGAYIDVEHALNVKHAATAGIILDRFILANPLSAEQALDMVIALIRSKVVSMVVLDSVAALVPMEELTQPISVKKRSQQCRLFSGALKLITAWAHHHSVTVVFINQVRGYEDRERGIEEFTPGGTALNYYASLRVRLRNIGPIQNRHGRHGSRIRAEIIKNQYGHYRDATDMDLLFGEGFDCLGDLFDLGVATGLIETLPGSYWFQKTHIGSDRETGKKWLANQTVEQRALTGMVAAQLA